MKLWIGLTLGLLVTAGHAGQQALAENRTFTKDEVAKHNSAASCYLIIEGVVYDVTKIMKEHSQKHEYDLTKWCGKEATRGWLEKDTKAKPHSRKAQVMLRPLAIGTLASEAKPPRP